MGLKQIGLSVVLTACLLSCASFAFNYRYHALDLPNSKLIGDVPEHDEEMAVCNPIADNKFPCFVVKSTEWFKIKRDYEELSQRLKACETGKPLELPQ
jgi:hypothetical protein